MKNQKSAAQSTAHSQISSVLTENLKTLRQVQRNTKTYYKESGAIKDGIGEYYSEVESAITKLVFNIGEMIRIDALENLFYQEGKETDDE